jgi:hypothetical protein
METVMERRRRGRSRRQRRDLEDDSGAPGTARFGEEGEVPWHWFLVQAAHATKEVKEALRDCLTGDEAPGRPAMMAASTSRGDGAREDGERCGRGEKCGVGLGRDFYRAGRGIGKRRLG